MLAPVDSSLAKNADINRNAGIDAVLDWTGKVIWDDDRKQVTQELVGGLGIIDAGGGRSRGC